LEPEITTSEAENAAERAETAVAEPATFSADGDQWRLSPDQLASAVEVAPQNGELELSLDRESLRGGLQEMYSSVNSQAREADFRFAGGGVEVVPGEIGQRIETRKLMDELSSGLPEGQREYDVSVVEDEPELTTERAEQLKPTEKIGDYRTTFETPGSDSPARVENLEIAGEALSGETVAPGEVFSANDQLAPVEWNEASTFINGSEEDALGGGLCQVASTLYMAANYAGLEPVERHPHFALLNYIRPGFDATLWFGAENGYSGQELDMKFRNTSDGYVMIREYVRDGYLYAEVWGQPTGRDVTMDSVDQGTNSESSKWTTYKTVENADGETAFDGVFHTDTYYSLQTEDGEVPPDEVNVAPVNP
ncbi:MAG: VanW family protein, partial [Rubrobacter sp.]|nr:VanW family protein [Rubrobacter sp.]